MGRHWDPWSVWQTEGTEEEEEQKWCRRNNGVLYRTVNRQIKKGMKKAKEDWIGEQCENIEDSLKKNNSKRAYHLVKDLTSTKQERTKTIQNKSGTCLTENEDVLKRWTEYCSELYNYRATGDPEVLNVPPATNMTTTLFFVKKWKQQWKHWRRESQQEWIISRQKWCKQVEKIW